MLIAALATAGAACTTTGTLDLDQAVTVLPLTIRAGGRIVVDVTVNDRGPYRFAVDTAATNSFVFESIQRDLALAPLPNVEANVHGAVASGAFPVVAVASLRVGEATWSNAVLAAIPGDTDATAPLDGVLGADFLRRFTVGFSARERSLRLFVPDAIAAKNYDGWSSIELEPLFFHDSVEPLRFFDIEIAGHRIPALFDLGAGTSVINTTTARLLRLTPVRSAQRGDFSGAVGTRPVMAQLSSHDVETGRVNWQNETFMIADLEIFDTLDRTDRPLAILGSGLFNQRDFIIDFARERLLIRRSMAELD